MLTDESASQSSGISDRAALTPVGENSPTHLPDRIQELASRVDNRSLTAVVVLDASHLETWEFEHGAQAFNDVMLAMWRCARSLCGVAIRQDDQVCLDAPGSDTLLIFVSEARVSEETDESDVPAPSELGELSERIKQSILRICRSHFEEWIGRAVEQTRAGAAPVNRADSVDPRREIYRAIRRARANIRGRATRRQRKRHEAVGSIIAEEKIETHFQPIVDLDEDRVVAYEALSRPSGTAFNQLDDEKLFDAARKAELDSELDRLCRDLSIKRRPALEGDTRLFVNCLPTAFCEPLEDLRAVIEHWEESELDAHQLVFEINENVSQQQADRILPTIDQLRQDGFEFALDDMGTGTTNLRVLADLEPTYIKMDISLTAGIGDNLKKKALASYLLDLADASGARLIAEGLETESDRKAVQNLGIRLGQGFLLGEPE